jgi:hypothetical protein
MNLPSSTILWPVSRDRLLLGEQWRDFGTIIEGTVRDWAEGHDIAKAFVTVNYMRIFLPCSLRDSKQLARSSEPGKDAAVKVTWTKSLLFSSFFPAPLFREPVIPVQGCDIAAHREVCNYFAIHRNCSMIEEIAASLVSWLNEFGTYLN